VETHPLTVFLLPLCLESQREKSTCHFLWELQRAELVCHYELKKQSMEPAGCGGLWDNISCWAPAAVGEVVTLSCPPALIQPLRTTSRNCTEAGWSDVYPSLSTVCWSSDNKPNMLLFYSVVKTLYTLGHSLSLIALITSTLILCLFRRLHCTRNYIHVNLFVSFILRAVAVLVKDSVIFSHNENTDCSTQPSLVGCKVSLYLHTLLLVTYAYTHLAVLLTSAGVRTHTHTRSHGHEPEVSSWDIVVSTVILQPLDRNHPLCYVPCVEAGYG
uniref:Vasoactive intestinal peptide receptor 2 n=1 Tax=Oncorhynchus kisutch TaxID=8019 RepID=A0A8C7LLT7_ONCKI